MTVMSNSYVVMKVMFNSYVASRDVLIVNLERTHVIANIANKLPMLPSILSSSTQAIVRETELQSDEIAARYLTTSILPRSLLN